VLSPEDVMITSFEELLAEYGLSHRSTELWKLARPAVRITSRLIDELDLPIGASKLGGTPDFPPGVEWPDRKGYPLALMAQFCLPDVAAYDSEGALPKTGMLYFFYDMIDEPWGYDPANGDAWRVIYQDVECHLLRRALPHSPIPDEYKLPVCDVRFHREITLPPYSADAIHALGLTDDEEHQYWQLVNSGPIHRLLGYPAEEQGDIRWEAQLASNGVFLGHGPIDLDDPMVRSLLPGISDWRLLFQMEDDNDNGAAWFGGAGGRLFYSIRKQDLADRNFDHIWVSFHWQ
jgi:uncharacterized protein YwqG